MTDTELDRVYTLLCKTMTDLGESRSQLFLARVAMLAIERLDNPQAAESLIAAASEDMEKA